MDDNVIHDGKSVIHNSRAFAFCCCCFSLRRNGVSQASNVEGDGINNESGRFPPAEYRENQAVPALQQQQQQHVPNISVQRTSTRESVATVYDLPPGWKAVPSRSRPDRTAFLNEFTGERISWIPTEPASTIKGEARKTKRRSKINNDHESFGSGEDSRPSSTA